MPKKSFFTELGEGLAKIEKKIEGGNHRYEIEHAAAKLARNSNLGSSAVTMFVNRARDAWWERLKSTFRYQMVGRGLPTGTAIRVRSLGWYDRNFQQHLRNESRVDLYQEVAKLYSEALDARTLVDEKKFLRRRIAKFERAMGLPRNPEAARKCEPKRPKK